jgi:hypothetical protein
MHLVMTNVTERFQILLYVSAALGMVLDVVQFEMPRVGGIPFLVGPTAPFTLVSVPTKYLPPHIVGDVPVMFRTLTIAL